MRTLLILLFCAAAHAGEKVKLWPAAAFTRVEAYCYDHTQDQRGTAIVFPDGSLHRGVIDSKTVKLDESQILKLRKLLTEESKKEFGESDCYEPHHAFVFYNEEGKVTASFDICFLCSGYHSNPEGVARNADLDALEAFCGELGLPMFEKPADYTKLYLKEHGDRKTQVEVDLSDDPFQTKD